MKRIRILMLIAFTCFLSVGWAQASSASVVTVTGKNTYPGDWNAVQAALNTPGVNTVKLVGTFNFGDPSNTVNCSAAIKIPG